MTTTLPLSSTRAPTVERYRTVRDLTEALAAPLSPEDQTVQSMPDVSPTKWHRAHVTWFFETFVLAPNVPGYQPFHPSLRLPLQLVLRDGRRAAPPTRPGAGHPPRGRRDRRVPGPRRRRHGRPARRRRPRPRRRLGWSSWGCTTSSSTRSCCSWTSSTSCRAARSPRPTCRSAVPPPGDVRPLGWVDHAGGLVDVGHAGDGFALRQRGPPPPGLAGAVRVGRPAGHQRRVAGVRRRRRLPAPRAVAVRRLVRRPGRRSHAPLYWREDDGGWTEFTLAGRCPLDPGRPVVHISYYEADAFARWADARLPTEAEWEAVACGRPVDGRTSTSRALRPEVGPPGDLGLFGDVWEWTVVGVPPVPRLPARRRRRR